VTGPTRGANTAVIPDTAIEWKGVRASGPGGQNVNKVASKVEMRVDLGQIRGLNEGARARLLTLASSRLDADGRLLVTSQLTRDQGRNLEDAREKVRALVAQAQVVPKARRPTRPSRAAKARRVDAKKLDARRKVNRGRTSYDD
jgi:ribosome-associated protein